MKFIGGAQGFPGGVYVQEVTADERHGIMVQHVIVRFADGYQMAFSLYNPTGASTFWFMHGLAHPPVPVYDLGLLPKLARDRDTCIIAPCAPEHGATDGIAGPDAFRLTIARQVELMDFLDVGRVLIIGHSLGAALALALDLWLRINQPERLLGDAPVALCPPTGWCWLDQRPVNPVTSTVLLGCLVPDTAVTWLLAAVSACATGDLGRFESGLRYMFTHPLNVSGAVNVLLTAPPLKEVVSDLNALGVSPRIGFALWDPSILLPVHLLLSQVHAFAFLGTHGSPAIAAGPPYDALTSQIDRAMGIVPDRGRSLLSSMLGLMFPWVPAMARFGSP